MNPLRLNCATQATPSRPRLTILAARFHPDAHGGVETCMWHTARNAAALGCDVRVVTENRRGAPDVENLADGVAVHRHVPLDAGPLWRWPTLPRLNWWRRIIRRHTPPGPLWATDPIMAAAVIVAGRRDELLYNPACCVHAMRRIHRAYPFVSTFRCSALLERLDRLAYRRAPRVIVSSDNLRRQMFDAYGPRDNIHVVPFGVDVEQPAPPQHLARRRFAIRPDAFVVGYVGRLDPCKDLGHLFHAFAAARCRTRAAMLIVGDGPDASRLNELAHSLRLTDRIIWAGRLDDPTEALAAMNVMVLPSLYEAFGNVILEAMSVATPVIARRRADDPARPVLTASDELIRHGETGLLIDSHDPADLSDRLDQLHLSPPLNVTLARNARRDTIGRTWRRTVERYLHLLDLPVAGRDPLDAPARRAA